jgi:hypothetical protein
VYLLFLSLKLYSMNSVKKMMPYLIASTLLVSISFESCKKESISTPQQVQDENAEVAQTVDAATTTTILTLKPSAGGQDAYVAYWQGDAGWASGNDDWAQELSMCAWTNGGLPMTVRSFIRFPSLNQLPTGAQIISANLFLYGKGSSISALQGNSAYPGSPYNTDNSCKVERVIGKQWKESTITWNTQPNVNTQDASVIPPSNSQWSYNVKVDVTNMVKTMATDLTKNYGFRISLVNETEYRSLIFASSENTNSALRPKLVIRYQ